MKRRNLLAGLAASALTQYQGRAASNAPTMFLEIKAWKLHNSEEDQGSRVSDFLDTALFPALTRAGAKPVAALGNLIAPDGPFYVTVVQYPSLASLQDVLAKCSADAAYQDAMRKLGSGAGLPFVRLESSLLQCFRAFPEAKIPEDAANRPPRIFELRTYESQTLATLQRKITMFNGGEIGIFERLNMRPVFFGECIIGAKQPCLTYMLSFDDLAAREKLWREFGGDLAWKRLSGPPEYHDSQIVSNISNVILRPLAFSPLR
ncbi:MAG TPA: NIPSNAP family protein [Bryobacteraceae bacterium]|nr:NIPSNAP family protein [Bryobacteraceae bacterium]